MVSFTDSGWDAGISVTVSALEVGINATADAVNRLSVSAPATLLNHEGGGHQLKLNKSGATDTASLLFQTGFSGRELGLTGSDRFAIKVSADGIAFTKALSVDPVSGQVKMPQGLDLSAPLIGTAVQAGALGSGLVLVS